VARAGRVIRVCVHSKRSTFQARIVCWTILIDLTDRLRLKKTTRQAGGERQRAAEGETVARAKNEAKDRFLGMLSHELRTPLRPALFAAARLVEDDIPEQSRMLGAVIKRNIEMEALQTTTHRPQRVWQRWRPEGEPGGRLRTAHRQTNQPRPAAADD
jgi:signal transduction histidine kinase